MRVGTKSGPGKRLQDGGLKSGHLQPVGNENPGDSGALIAPRMLRQLLNFQQRQTRMGCRRGCANRCSISGLLGNSNCKNFGTEWSSVCV